MAGDMTEWLRLTCRGCLQGTRVWAANCVLVTPPGGTSHDDVLCWTCSRCGPQVLALKTANVVDRCRVYGTVSSRLKLVVREGGPLELDLVIDLDRDLADLLHER